MKPEEKSKYSSSFFYEISKAGVQGAIGELSKNIISRFASATARAVSEEMIKAAAGFIPGLLLDLIFRASSNLQAQIDELDKRIVDLEQKVRDLYAEPLITGLRTGFEALALPANADDEITFREIRLHQALHALDSALTIYTNGELLKGRSFYIRLLQIAFALPIRGGKSFTRQKINECVQRIDKKLGELRRLIPVSLKFAEEMEQDALQLEASFPLTALNRTSKYLDFPLGGHHAMDSRDLHKGMIRRSGIRAKRDIAKETRAEVDRFKREIDDLNSIKKNLTQLRV